MNQTQAAGAAAAPAIRPADGADAGALAELLTGLTELSLYFRFQTAIGRPPRPALLDRLLNPAGAAWLATRGSSVVGHAMWAWSGTRIAELAVIVADQEQGRGVGSRLLLTAGRDAWRRGAEQFLFVVSPANDRMARKIRRTWPGVTAARNGDLIEFVIPAAALDHLVPTMELDLPGTIPVARQILV